MNRVVLLKTQLDEAAKFAKSKTYRHKRLAVILLDNFIEIQLSNLIKEKFLWNGDLTVNNKKYSEDEKKNILKYHEALLKASVCELFINVDEQKMISFCHDIRNNLYHKTNEDELLVNVALKTLHKIISFRQPQWKAGKMGIITGSRSVNDLHTLGKIRKAHDSNTDEGWEYFLSKYFNFVDKREKNSSMSLEDYLMNKIISTRKALKFLRTNNREIFVPKTKNWDYNDYFMAHFFNDAKEKDIVEITKLHRADRENYDLLGALDNLHSTFASTWKYKKESRLDSLEKSIRTIGKAPINKALEKYISLKDEVNIILEVFTKAESHLAGAIQYAKDVAKGK